MAKTKNLISWSVGLIFVAGVVALIAVSGNGSNSNPDTYSAGVLTAIENSFDFNTISMKDGNVSHVFEIENNGTELVEIEKVYTSCMCTTTYITDSRGKRYGEFGMQGHSASSRTSIKVGPGDLISVNAVFDPAAHGPSGVGLAERSVYLETNSAKSPKIELRFTALVIK